MFFWRSYYWWCCVDDDDVDDDVIDYDEDVVVVDDNVIYADDVDAVVAGDVDNDTADVVVDNDIVLLMVDDFLEGIYITARKTNKKNKNLSLFLYNNIHVYTSRITKECCIPNI